MKNFKITALFFVLYFFYSSAPFFAAAAEEEVLALMQNRYDSITSITADFSQENYYKTLKKRDKASGKVLLKKPGKMKWMYLTPVKDELISDGKTLWYYQPDLAQAMETNLIDGPPAVATGFLMGGAEFKKDFTVGKAVKKKNGASIKLIPRLEQKNLKAVTLELDKDYTVEKAVIEDAYGGETTVVFSNIVVNKKTDDALFKFKAPKGVVINK